MKFATTLIVACVAVAIAIAGGVTRELLRGGQVDEAISRSYTVFNQHPQSDEAISRSYTVFNQRPLFDEVISRSYTVFNRRPLFNEAISRSYTVERCDVDSDGDGVVDCVDVCPCTHTLLCSPSGGAPCPPVCADLCPCTPAPGGVDAEGRPLGDLDGDCDVDLIDFQTFELNYTGP